MKPTLEIPPLEIINETLTYDPQTGDLFWKERPLSHFKNRRGQVFFNRKFAGKVAGHKHIDKTGRPTAIVIRGHFGGKDMWLLAHRIIYAIMGVTIPDGMEIDHKNMDPWDNRWDNLRLATTAQNQANRPGQKRTHPDHIGLPKGVTKYFRKYKAQIALGGKKRHIGLYNTPEEAGQAYMEEARKAVGEFARG